MLGYRTFKGKFITTQEWSVRRFKSQSCGMKKLKKICLPQASSAAGVLEQVSAAW